MKLPTSIAANSFFRAVSSERQQEILKYAMAASLPVGAFYVHEGDRPEHLALVAEGRLRVYKTAESGREITLYHVGPGECCLLNITCLLSHVPCPASAVVIEPLEAALVPADRFRAWMATDPEVREYVFAKLSSQIADMMALVEEVSFASMDRRLAGFLLTHAPQRDGIVPQLAMTHDQIARELGTAREVVSRLLKEFERRGAVELARGRIRIADRKALSAEA